MFHTDPEVVLPHLSQADRQLGTIILRFGPYSGSCHRGTVFQGLLKSIVYQQLSGKAAKTIHTRLINLLPRGTIAQAKTISELDDAALRGVGLSRPKTVAVRDLARRQIAGQLPDRRRLSRMDDEQIIEKLCEVHGVGRWTAEMILIFWLGRADVLPTGDLGVRKGFGTLIGADAVPAPDTLQAYGEKWRPYRSIAAWYLWRIADQAADPASTGEW